MVILAAGPRLRAQGPWRFNLIDRKKKGIITTKRVQTFFRIELRQDYHRDVPTYLGGTSYFDILTKIVSGVVFDDWNRPVAEPDI